MSTSTIYIALAILGILWWFLRRRRTNESPQNHHPLPPGPRGLPIIGNLHMLGSLPHRAITKLAKRYGSIMFLRLGNEPTVVVSSPSAAELFLNTDDTVFASRPGNQSAKVLSYGYKGLAFTPYGSYWRNVRKFCTRELLSATKIDSLAWMRKEELRLFVDSLREAAEGRVVVDVTEKVRQLVQDMICRMLFGRSRDVRFNLSEMLEEMTETVGAFNIADYVPFLGPLDIQGLTRRVKKTSKDFERILDIIIDEHEINVDHKHEDDMDFVDMLLSLKNKSTIKDDDISSTFTRTNVKAVIQDMIFGATDTSHTAIGWVMSELVRHPHIMTRVQKELEVVVGENDIVEESHLPKLGYLYMVVKETLRLYPVAPLSVPHQSTEDIVISGYYIPKNSRIIINNWGLGRDTNTWSENALEFLPERFIGSKLDIRGHDFELIPFGSGRKGCPRMHLGLINIQLVVAQIVHCFDLEFPASVSPSQLDMDEKFGLAMTRVNHIFAIPTIRKRKNDLAQFPTST